MNGKIGLVLLALTAAGAVGVDAQVKLRGNYVFNRASVDTENARLTSPKQGYGAGVDVILPGGLGIALSGYTSGRVSDFDPQSTAVVVLAEANYFLRLPLRLTPYAGVHSGLGRFTGDFFDDPFLPKFQDNAGEVGYQVGLRFQPIGALGLDAQWRRLSGFASDAQDSSMQKEQVVLGITLF